MSFQSKVQELVAAEVGQPAEDLDFSQLEVEVELDWESRDDATVLVVVSGGVFPKADSDARQYVQLNLRHGDIYDELHEALTAAVRLPA